MKIKILFFSLLLLFSANTAFAGLNLLSNSNSNPMEQSNALATYAGFNQDARAQDIVASVIKVFLSILGVVFVILIIIAGFNWMTAQGDEGKIEKAQKTIKAAVIGLVIIVAAYAITKFVFTHLPGGGSGENSGVQVNN